MDREEGELHLSKRMARGSGKRKQRGRRRGLKNERCDTAEKVRDQRPSLARIPQAAMPAKLFADQAP